MLILVIYSRAIRSNALIPTAATLGTFISGLEKTTLVIGWQLGVRVAGSDGPPN
jgi:hypothetical protein